ncbi:MAG: efflux RND transporter periplasmic adaptor subunit [Eubacteriales bacterium]|nr:efflux RND transporter periplasmic adaptor subunit [Eubacteriales bacterium]MDD3882970.1 efflux RND transporter periplasmic adaptor subunit [Eubacteriales bacterium]MDD4513483.1 efflux RND transporter periplasmic adaptor subunit [Eubacteriales bacterium]
MKVFKKIVSIVLTLAILGAAGYGAYYLYRKNQDEKATPTVSYTAASVTSGSLVQSVSGTGSVSIAAKKNVKLDFDVTLSDILVQEGQTVTEGEILAKVDTVALNTTIATLASELATCNSTIYSLASDYETTETIKAGVSGRVKSLTIEKGDMLQKAMADNLYIAAISLDGLMSVQIEAGNAAVGNAVTIMDGEKSYAGKVLSIDDGVATITFPDYTTLPGANVNVIVGGVILGSAEAQIHMPYYLTSTIEGYVSKVYAVVNRTISSSGNFAYITNIPPSAEYTSATADRDAAQAKLKAAQEIKDKGGIVAPASGIASTIDFESGDALAAGTALTTLYVGASKQMVVSIDELDITGVSLGQSAEISMDAITGKTYSASVSYISQLGTSTSGVTNYSVTLAIDADEQLKIGMNGTATIITGGVSDAALVPIAAIYTDKNGDFVYLQSQETTEDGLPGIKTYIKTGLSNESYAQVLSGLNIGDSVMISRTAASAASTSSSARGVTSIIGGDTGAPQGAGMPAGGTIPSGGAGGTRNYGSGSGSGSGSGRSGN